MKTNPSIVDVFWGHLCLGTSKSTDTVRGHCMRVLGELAHHFPVEVSTEHVYERGLLYDRCVNVLKADVMPGNPKTWLLSGALVGIGGLLQARRRAPAHPSAGGRPPPPPLPPSVRPPNPTAARAPLIVAALPPPPTPAFAPPPAPRAGV